MSARGTRGARLIAGALVATAAGCASLRGGEDPSEPAPRERLEEAAAMLDRGDFRGAHPVLGWVYARCPAAPEGRQALLLMAAAELDPRNDARRLDVGTALAAEYVALPGAPAEGRPLAETLYLLGLELGAEAPGRIPVAPVDSVLTPTCELPRGVPARPMASRGLAEGTPPGAPGERVVDATWLPELTGPTVPERLAALRAQRDSASAQTAALMEQMKQLQARVASQQQEIERIRKTLRP